MELKENKIEFNLEEFAPLLIANNGEQANISSIYSLSVYIKKLIPYIIYILRASVALPVGVCRSL